MTGTVMEGTRVAGENREEGNPTLRWEQSPLGGSLSKEPPVQMRVAGNAVRPFPRPGAHCRAYHADG